MLLCNVKRQFICRWKYFSSADRSSSVWRGWQCTFTSLLALLRYRGHATSTMNEILIESIWTRNYMIPRAETWLFTIYQIERVGQLMNPILNYPLSHTNKTQCSLKHKQLIMVINTHTPVVAVRRMVPFRFELPFPSLTLLNYVNLFTLLMWEFHSLPSQDLLPFKNCSVIHDGSYYVMFTFSCGFDIWQPTASTSNLHSIDK